MRTRSCTSHFVHLKWSLVHACPLTCTSLCTYCKNRNINPETSPGIQTVFIEKEATDGSLVYPEPDKQITFRQLCLKAMNMVVLPSVCRFETARLFANILTGTSRLCRNGHLDTFRYPHNSRNIYNFHKHGGLLCKQTTKSCGKGV